ncbi:M4 family metallopeptidase [Pleionea sediminis]|uniref:M4 family metallopeptidase n=1 Tax=Pleionea sediminis TaxID=2569479 RepID=UPI001185F0FD|nr:M4 family metallopeptidase [Pleionea sediminis]
MSGIDNDYINLEPTLSDKEALNLAQHWLTDSENVEVEFSNLENLKQQLAIGFDASKKAHLVYQISFLLHDPLPSQPYFEVDAHSGEILNYHDSLKHFNATGSGGNERIGRYRYGLNYGYLKVRQEGAQCIMENDEVQTIDLKGATSGGETYSFQCPDNSPPPINGAYSPVNDAHYIAGKVYKFYRNWLGVEVLPFKVKMKLNYGQNYQNAFWAGDSFYMGDGGQQLFSFTSRDIIAHEMSHGFTEQYSNLHHEGQSGALSESYSDLAGEAFEYYAYGYADWVIGADIFKESGNAFRYIYDPTRDGHSIDHASDYTDDMDIHHAAGVFNKAFSLMSNYSFWNIEQTFQVFARANMYYWTERIDWIDAAEAIRLATQDLGYDTCAVDLAFYQVGILPDRAAGYCRATSLSHNRPVTGISGNANDEIYYLLWVSPDETHVTFTISGGRGDVDLYVKKDGFPTTSDYDCRPYRSGNNETCTLSLYENSAKLSEPLLPVYVMLKGYRNFSNVTLLGRYDVVHDMVYSDISLTQDEWKYYYFWLPEGSGNLSIKTFGGNGDVDLYVGKNYKPTLTEYVCRPYRWGNRESCEISEPDGVIYVGLRGYSDSSGITLEVKGSLP